jgi:hypothetical protein
MDFAVLPPEIGLGRPGRRVRFHGILLRLGGLCFDQRGVAGPVVGFHGCRGRTVCGVDERHCGTG